MRLPVVSVLLAFSFAATALPAQNPNLITPENLIPSIPDIPHTKLSKWKPDTGRTTLTLNTDRGILRGYLYAGKDPAAPTILFFNSNGQTITDNEDFYRKLAALGPSVAAYDYLGYGFSGGTANVLAFQGDGVALYDQTVAQAPNHKVIVYGYALGTAVATYIASKRTVAGVILAAPMATALEEHHYLLEQRDASATAKQLLRVDPDVATTLDEAGMIKQSTAPLLVIHGTADKTISFAQGREVFAASPSVKKYFVKIDGADNLGLPVQVGAYQSVKLFLPVVEKEPAK